MEAKATRTGSVGQDGVGGKVGEKARQIREGHERCFEDARRTVDLILGGPKARQGFQQRMDEI